MTCWTTVAECYGCGATRPAAVVLPGVAMCRECLTLGALHQLVALFRSTSTKERGMTLTYTCPACSAELVVDGRQETVDCGECRYRWLVEYDGDVVEGVPQDCTRIVAPSDASREQRALVVVMRIAERAARGQLNLTRTAVLEIKAIADAPATGREVVHSD